MPSSEYSTPIFALIKSGAATGAPAEKVLFIKVSSKNYEFFSQVWEELESILNELMPFDDNRMFDTIAKDLFANFLICNSGKYITDVNLYEEIKEEFESLTENETLKKFKEILVNDNRRFIFFTDYINRN